MHCSKPKILLSMDYTSLATAFRCLLAAAMHSIDQAEATAVGSAWEVLEGGRLLGDRLSRTPSTSTASVAGDEDTSLGSVTLGSITLDESSVASASAPLGAITSSDLPPAGEGGGSREASAAVPLPVPLPVEGPLGGVALAEPLPEVPQEERQEERPYGAGWAGPRSTAESGVGLQVGWAWHGVCALSLYTC